MIPVNAVLIEYMPAQHRASHAAAGNMGRYPLNGARRVWASAEFFGELGEWATIMTDDGGDYPNAGDGDWDDILA